MLGKGSQEESWFAESACVYKARFSLIFFSFF